MLDWFTGAIKIAHPPLKNGMVASFDSHGEIDWEIPRRQSVEGSHSSKIQVRSAGGDGKGGATHLQIHGNVTKYLQGHNVFGTDDLLTLVYDAVVVICATLEIYPTAEELHDIKIGNYKVNRIDVNYMFDLPSNADVNTWLKAAEFTSKTRHGRACTKGGTVYWGKTSRRWSVKAYNKYEEMQKHHLPDSLKSTKLEAYAQNKLRVELTLRTKELENLELPTASKIQKIGLRHLYKIYIKRIEMTQQIRLSDKQFNELPPRLRSTYVLWQHGEDIRGTLPKTTFYRHRKELLEQYDIDVQIMRSPKDAPNVIPLIRILEAKESAIPQWAYDQKLVHK